MVLFHFFAIANPEEGGCLKEKEGEGAIQSGGMQVTWDFIDPPTPSKRCFGKSIIQRYECQIHVLVKIQSVIHYSKLYPCWRRQRCVKYVYLLSLYRIDETEPEEGYKVALKANTMKHHHCPGPGTKEV